MRAYTNLENGTGKIWDSIEEMPVYNWVKILETGDLKYLYKEEEGKVTKRLQDIWLDLQQQYIDEFDFDEKFKARMRIVADIATYNCEFVLTGDRMLKNYILMSQKDLENLDKEKAHSFYEVLDYVEKYKGYQIDPKKITVIRWYHTLENMARHGKKD